MDDYLEVERVIQEILTSGEFTDSRYMYGTDMLKNKEEYYCVPELIKCVDGKRIDAGGEYVSSERVYTIAMKLIGRRGYFNDTDELNRRIRKMLKYLIKDSGLVVRNITRGGFKRNFHTSRLEIVMTVTLVGFQRISRI